MRERENENVKGYDRLLNISNLNWGFGLVVIYEIVTILEILLLEGKYKVLVWDL